MEKRWVRYMVDEQKEETAFELHGDPRKDLRGALIAVPEGGELTDIALETLRHFRYYMERTGGCVLLGDSTVILTKPAGLEEMLEQAEDEAGDVTGHMPDFELLPTDDGCTLLAMGERTFTFREVKIPGNDVLAGLLLRNECLEACERLEPLAAVWFDGNEGEELFGEK